MKLFKRNKKTTKSTDRQGASKQQRVYTYYTASKRQIEQFEKSNRHEQKRGSGAKERVYAVGQKSVAISIVIVGLFLLIFTLFITAEANIKIEGESSYNSANYYKDTVNNALQSNYSYRFKPTLNEEEIEKEISQKLPEATEVEVTANAISRGVNVNITTSEAFAVLIQKDAPSYLLDNNGKLVVDINNTDIDTANLSTITNESKITYSIGDQIFKPAEAEAINNLHFQYTKGSEGKRVSYVLPLEPREVHVLHPGYYARYSTDEETGADIIQQYGALRAVQNKIEDKQGSAPKEYIDVRLGDKVFVN